MRIQEIANNQSNGFLTDKEEILEWVLYASSNLVKSNVVINEDKTVDIIGTRILINERVEELKVQFRKVYSSFDVTALAKLKNVKGFPLSCASIDISDCPNITTLNGLQTQFCPDGLNVCGTGIKKLSDIFPHVKFTTDYISIGDLGIKSLVGIEKMQISTSELLLGEEKDYVGGIGLLLIPNLKKIGVARFRGSRFGPVSKNTEKALNIVNDYIGRPSDIYECQSRLIDEGLEKFAEI